MAIKPPGQIEATGGEPTIPQVVPKSGITTAPPKDAPRPARERRATAPTPVRAATPVTRERARQDAIRNVRERDRVLGRNRSRVIRSWFWNGVEHHELDDGSVAKSTSEGRTLSLGSNASSTSLRVRPTVIAINEGKNPVQGIVGETSRSALGFVKNLAVDAAEIFIPGVWIKDWDSLSNRDRALNAALDLIIFVPVVGVAAKVSTRPAKSVIKSAIRAGSNVAEASKVGRALNKIENAIVLGDGQAIREATAIIKESARKSKVNLDKITREINRKADEIADIGSKPKADPPPDLKRNLKEQEKVVKKIDDETKDIGGASKPSNGAPSKRSRPPTRKGNGNGKGVQTGSKEQFDKGSSVAIAEAADEARKAASLREILETTRPLRVSRIRPKGKSKGRKPRTKDRKRVRPAQAPKTAPRARTKPKPDVKPEPAPGRAPSRQVAPLPRARAATEAQAEAEPQPQPQRPSPRAPAPAATAVGRATGKGTRVGTPTGTPTGLGGRVGTPTATPTIPGKAPPTTDEARGVRGVPTARGEFERVVKEPDISFNLPSGTFARKVIYRQGRFWVTLTLDGSDPIFSQTKPPQAKMGRTPKQTFKVTELSKTRPTQKMFDQGRARVTVTGRGISFRGN